MSEEQPSSSSKRNSSSSSSGGSEPSSPNPALQGPLVSKQTVRSRGDKLRDDFVHNFLTPEGLLATLHTFLPITSWLPNYPIRKNLYGDLVAGLTVGVMIIPQSMGYAGVAGLPPVYGLYTALVPIFIYATMGTSRQLSVGPVAIMSLLVGALLPTLVPDPTDVADYVRLAGVLALMGGVMNATLGVLRLGFLVSLLSPAVVCGFMTASSIIIFCTQLKDAFGVSIARTNYFYLNVFWTAQQAWSMNWVAVVMCLLSLIFIYVSPPTLPPLFSSLFFSSLDLCVFPSLA